MTERIGNHQQHGRPRIASRTVDAATNASQCSSDIQPSIEAAEPSTRTGSWQGLSPRWTVGINRRRRRPARRGASIRSAGSSASPLADSACKRRGPPVDTSDTPDGSGRPAAPRSRAATGQRCATPADSPCRRNAGRRCRHSGRRSGTPGRRDGSGERDDFGGRRLVLAQVCDRGAVRSGVDYAEHHGVVHLRLRARTIRGFGGMRASRDGYSRLAPAFSSTGHGPGQKPQISTWSHTVKPGTRVCVRKPRSGSGACHCLVRGRGDLFGDRGRLVERAGFEPQIWSHDNTGTDRHLVENSDLVLLRRLVDRLGDGCAEMREGKAGRARGCCHVRVSFWGKTDRDGIVPILRGAGQFNWMRPAINRMGTILITPRSARSVARRRRHSRACGAVSRDRPA